MAILYKQNPSTYTFRNTIAGDTFAYDGGLFYRKDDGTCLVLKPVAKTQTPNGEPAPFGGTVRFSPDTPVEFVDIVINTEPRQKKE